MRTLLPLLIFLSFSSAYATHNKGGYITYTAISDYTYDIRVTIYTTEGNASDSISLNGNMIALDSMGGSGFSTYTFLATFPGAGSYLFTVEDPNRNDSVMNMPNSVNTPLYFESMIRILDPDVGINSSPNFLHMYSFLAFRFQLYQHNMLAFDKDGDRLRFELVACKGAGGAPIPGYKFPDELGGNGPLTMNDTTGELTWDVPVLPGPYNIAIKITESRFGVEMGYILMDLQLEVKDDWTSQSFSRVSPASSVTVIPNPFRDQAIIRIFPFPQSDLQLDLFNILGKQYGSLHSKEGQFIVDRKGVPAGIYLFRITDGNEFIGAGRLVIE